jgi:hypothetical protein
MHGEDCSGLFTWWRLRCMIWDLIFDIGDGRYY